MYDERRKEQWKKEHTVRVTLRLFKTTDADILSAIDGKAKATEIKRLVRLGLKCDKH